MTSTNTIAAEWADDDAPDGAVVCAEEQTAGRGRFDRVWTASAGQNLTFSLVLFPGLPADRLGMISVAFSVAAVRTLRQLAGLRGVEVKWPNDVLVGGAKICGMLQESAFAPTGGSRRVILGIGLNVNQTIFPADLRPGVTSLKIETGQDYDRVEILADLLNRMEDVYRALHTGREREIRSRYEASLQALGREVSFVQLESRQVASGIVTGIDDRGGLVVSTPAGKETIYAGDVSLRMA